MGDEATVQAELTIKADVPGKIVRAVDYLAALAETELADLIASADGTKEVVRHLLNTDQTLALEVTVLNKRWAENIQDQGTRHIMFRPVGVRNLRSPALQPTTIPDLELAEIHLAYAGGQVRTIHIGCNAEIPVRGMFPFTTEIAVQNGVIQLINHNFIPNPPIISLPLETQETDTIPIFVEATLDDANIAIGILSSVARVGQFAELVTSNLWTLYKPISTSM